MEGYTSEKEQIETIKSWWKENGKSVVTGLTVGLLIVGGWKFWVNHRNAQAEAASAAYDQFIMDMSKGDHKAAAERGGFLINEYNSSSYAALAALALARMKVEDGDLAAARTHLQWVLDHGKDQAMKEVAKLRLARVVLDQGDATAALAVLKDAPSEAFTAAYEELRGDIYVAMNNHDEARKAYAKALESAKERKSPWVQMKLDDLGGGRS